MFIVIISIFTIDRFIPNEPKGKFGKWWVKHIVGREK